MILDSKESPPGTHPSYASSCIKVKCDGCGRQFNADCKIDDIWYLHGIVFGARDYRIGSVNERLDFCVRCAHPNGLYLPNQP